LDRPKRWLLGCALEGISNGKIDDGWMFVGELSISPTSWDQQARTLDFVGIHNRRNLSCKQTRLKPANADYESKSIPIKSTFEENCRKPDATNSFDPIQMESPKH
jgi:hypothetical protein